MRKWKGDIISGKSTTCDDLREYPHGTELEMIRERANVQQYWEELK